MMCGDMTLQHIEIPPRITEIPMSYNLRSTESGTWTGLGILCSIHLSYGGTIDKPVSYNNFYKPLDELLEPLGFQTVSSLTESRFFCSFSFTDHYLTHFVDSVFYQFLSCWTSADT